MKIKWLKFDLKMLEIIENKQLKRCATELRLTEEAREA